MTWSFILDHWSWSYVFCLMYTGLNASNPKLCPLTYLLTRVKSRDASASKKHLYETVWTTSSFTFRPPSTVRIFFPADLIWNLWTRAHLSWDCSSVTPMLYSAGVEVFVGQSLTEEYMTLQELEIRISSALPGKMEGRWSEADGGSLAGSLFSSVHCIRAHQPIFSSKCVLSVRCTISPHQIWYKQI